MDLEILEMCEEAQDEFADKHKNKNLSVWYTAVPEAEVFGFL